MQLLLRFLSLLRTQDSTPWLSRRLRLTQACTLANMKADGTIYDEESYIRQLVMTEVIPKVSMEDSKSRAFAAAQQSSRIM